MLRRLAALMIAVPTFATAQCTSFGVEHMMSSENLARLDADAAATPYGQGLYWTATMDGVELAIVGTMHLADPRHDALIARVASRLEQADLLLVEATLEDQTAMQTYLAQNPDMITITSGPTLPERLDPAVWAQVRKAAGDRGVPGFMAAKMQPWFLSMTLAMPPCAMASMVAGEVGLDGMLMEQAAGFGVPVMPLEDWRDMLGLLTSGTFEEQLEALQLSLLGTDIQNAMISSLITSYFAEETAYGWQLGHYLPTLEPTLDAEAFAAQMVELEDTLLIGRNHNWMPVIADAAQVHDRAFIAVGAAHLIGDKGILQLLENDGWTLTRQ